MDFLQLKDKTVLLFGLANRKSVAYHTGRVLAEAGADVLYSVRTEERRQSVQKLAGDAPVFVCDVSEQAQIDRLRDEVSRQRERLHGIVHSIAFADYSAYITGVIEEELDRMRESYDKKALVVKEEERRSLEKDLEVRSLDFKRKYEDFQRDLKRTDGELTSGIVEQLYGIVNTYARERKFTVVLEASSGAIVYADSSVDVTDEVIKRHNAR